MLAVPFEHNAEQSLLLNQKIHPPPEGQNPIHPVDKSNCVTQSFGKSKACSVQM